MMSFHRSAGGSMKLLEKSPAWYSSSSLDILRGALFSTFTFTFYLMIQFTAITRNRWRICAVPSCPISSGNFAKKLNELNLILIPMLLTLSHKIRLYVTRKSLQSFVRQSFPPITQTTEEFMQHKYWHDSGFTEISKALNFCVTD